MKQVTVTVPATTANLGPGFDCLGLALGLYNEVTFTETAAGLAIQVTGEGSDRLPADDSNLVVRAAERLFQLAGRRPPGLRVQQRNTIPIGSGLGSSAAAVLGGMLAANALVGYPLARDEVLALAAGVEGHPDNVAPALLGGLVLALAADEESTLTPAPLPGRERGGRLLVEQIDVPPLQVVVVLPAFELPTAVARAALSQQVPLTDAVFNAGRLGLLLRALARGDWAKLGAAMQDRLHQPYRLPLVPGLTEAMAAARAAGAAGVA
ncbi:MAG: homoserine kinase, partial [Chloroflexota bacterium]